MLNPNTAYRNYFQTYVERDVRQLIHIKDLQLFQRFIKLCAGRIGQVLNINSLSNEVDIIYKSGHELIPVEIKSTETFNPFLLKKIDFFHRLTGERSPRGYLIYGGMHHQKIHNDKIINYLNSEEIVL